MNENEMRNKDRPWAAKTLCLLALASPLVHAEGVKSPYTEVIQTLLNDDGVNPDAIRLKCWTLPKNDLYIGVEQRLRIHAPIADALKTVEAVDQYDQLFPDFKKIALVSQTGNHSVISFEQSIPIPFVPNIHYEMLYTKLEPAPDQFIFWYQLKNQGALKASDGFIRLKKISATETDYTEYDFFDAEWGIAKIAGVSKLWQDAVKGIYWSDLSLKMKSENQAYTSGEALKNSKKALDAKKIEACVKERSEWQNLSPSKTMSSPGNPDAKTPNASPPAPVGSAG